MISRSVARSAQRTVRQQCRRGIATSFSYESSDVAGVKTASRDIAGPTTKLAVVAKAGTRYESAPGLTTGLEQFAFKVP